MDPRSSLSECQREQLVALFESGMGNRAAATSLGLTRNAVRRLEQRWKLHGRLCLVEKPTNQAYSFEVKKEVVDRFLAGETAMDLAAEFNLNSKVMVHNWARIWRREGDDGLRPKRKGRPPRTDSKPLTEEEQLRRRVQFLEAENAYLKKLRDLKDHGHAGGSRRSPPSSPSTI